VFGDHNTSSPRHERRRCRDVDGSLRVATGATGVYDVFGGCDLFREAAHGAGKADYLPDGLAPHPQGGQQGGRHRRVDGAFHNLFERPFGLPDGEMLAGRGFS
jgi:hypothetical protein